MRTSLSFTCFGGLRSELSTLTSHKSLLSFSENHEGLHLTLGAVLEARFLVSGEIGGAQGVDAVVETDLVEIELHLHLLLGFEFVLHFSRVLIFNYNLYQLSQLSQINNVNSS